MLFRVGEWDLYAARIFGSTAAMQVPVMLLLLFSGTSESFLDASLSALLLSLTFAAGVWGSILVYRAFFHRLTRFPGPFAARLSNIYLTLLSVRHFQLFEEIQALHQKYGDIVRAQGSSQLRILKHFTLFTMLNPSMYTKQLITKIDASQGSSLNIATWFNFYSFDVMGDLAFGKGFEMLKDGVAHYFMELSHSGIKSVAAFSHLVWIFPLLKTVPVLNTQHLRFQAWLAERVRLRRELKLEAPDVFSWILADYEQIENPTAQDTLNLHGDAHVIVVAGSDTTAASLTCLFFELATHPTVLKSLQEELDAHFFNGGELSYPSLSKLRYLQACINETLRMHPAIPSGLQRMTPPEGLRIGDIWIPGNTIVKVPTHTLQRDERAFIEPNTFIPERWTSKPELIKDASAFAPFSMGRYSCVGKQLALMELSRVTTEVIFKYNIELAPSQTKEAFLKAIKDTFTMATSTLNLVFQRRGS
ncbi:hypothetical protein NQ176_g6345 [Zarea fungicola]|uniref:Uncharacterized protein n=1 Tax=Zarea fungicola TaxID=93591 RepID=A0ACC1N4R4_9HYPO|nr:hypothetical protein NQ176_g6345 [Lecanicillium fungicola]